MNKKDVRQGKVRKSKHIFTTSTASQRNSEAQIKMVKAVFTGV